MKIRISFLFAASIFWAAVLSAQEPAPAQPPTIAKSLGMYIFPGEGQDAATQQNDEGACYAWAVEQSGVDPLNLPEVQAAEVPARTGAAGAVGGAARGAIAGAAIGAIAGDAGKGAAIGATAGGMGGLRAGRRAGARAEQQAGMQAQQQEQQMLEQFKKAFSVCMEGKGYTIK